jgi:replicative DNA helicase
MDYEAVLLGMLLRSPKTMLPRIVGDLFAWPGNRAVFDAVQRLADRGERITVESVRMEAGDQAHNVPDEPWFTIANATFYIQRLERRNARKRRRTELLDELRRLNEGTVADSASA